MSSLDDLVMKAPRPLIVFIILALSVGALMYLKPMHFGCDAQVSNFSLNVSGYLTNLKNDDKSTTVAQIVAYKDFCKKGNTQGACARYLSALQKISSAFVSLEDRCLPELVEDEKFVNLKIQISDAMKILSLLAWGESPPESPANKLGWLSQTEVYTFCRFQNILKELISESEYKEYEESILREFPARWPDKYKDEMSGVPEDIRRPTAYKWAGNPSGTMNRDEVRQRSLLSLRCDAYR